MTSVIGFSGKKQSGKNTAANFVLGTVMKNLGYTKGFKITPNGELYVYDLLEDISQAGIFNIMENSQRIQRFKEQWLDNHIKIYSFADALKQDVCMNVLGLSHEQCYGTDEQKNTLTDLRWEDMPGVTTHQQPDGFYNFVQMGGTESVGDYFKTIQKQLTYHAPGQMTAREVMQFAGTELFRKMSNNVWVNATIRKIKNDRPKIAVICDVRFHNEGDGIYDLAYTSDGEMQGYVVRLLRDPFAGQDQHESETAMDNYPTEKYYAIIDNKAMSISEQNSTIEKALLSVLTDRNPF